MAIYNFKKTVPVYKRQYMNSNGKNPIAKRKIPFSPVVIYAIGSLISVQPIKMLQNRFPTTLCCENELYIRIAENAETMIPKNDAINSLIVCSSNVDVVLLLRYTVLGLREVLCHLRAITYYNLVFLYIAYLQDSFYAPAKSPPK